MTQRLSIVGCGTMGRAIVGGLLASGEASSWTLGATVGHADEAAQLRRALPQVDVGVDNAAEVARADVVLLATKPQAAGEVLTGHGMPEALAGKLLLSICAGITLGQLSSWAPESRVIRVMPNTPALIREGMTVLSPGDRATAEDLDLARRIFDSVGRTRVLDEKHLDVVTGLSGSGPAFACVILEAMADGAVMMGLPRHVAIELAAQTLQGTARMVLATGEHPAALRDRVTTPAGCTIAGLFKMEEGRVRSTVAQTIQVAAQVASGLGQSTD
ncbi:MAG: pyrroline-5-carboxylate reductase [Alphaproteobacteria bacterium]|nr:pyrroline-5-carboxylate reductase [Alphaproteobacteria bacterium]